MHTWRA